MQMTLMEESEEEFKSLLMKVKEESGKDGLKLNIQQTKIMASGPTISWLQSLSMVILEPKRIKSVTVSIITPSVCQEVMGPNVIILVFVTLILSQLFHSLLSLSLTCSSGPLHFLP